MILLLLYSLTNILIELNLITEGSILYRGKTSIILNLLKLLIK